MLKVNIVRRMIPERSEVLKMDAEEHGAAYSYYLSWRPFGDILPDRNYKLVTPNKFSIGYSQFLKQYSLPRDLQGTQQSDFDRLTITATSGDGDKILVSFRAPDEVVDLATVCEIVGEVHCSDRQVRRLIIVLQNVKLTDEEVLLIHNTSPVKLEFFHLSDVTGGWIKMGSSYEMITAEEKQGLFMKNFKFMCRTLTSKHSRYYGFEGGEFIKCVLASDDCVDQYEGSTKRKSKKRKNKQPGVINVVM